LHGRWVQRAARATPSRMDATCTALSSYGSCAVVLRDLPGHTASTGRAVLWLRRSQRRFGPSCEGRAVCYTEPNHLRCVADGAEPSAARSRAICEVDPMGREVYRCLWMERASTRQASRWGSHQQQGAPIAHTIFFPSAGDIPVRTANTL